MKHYTENNGVSLAVSHSRDVLLQTVKHSTPYVRGAFGHIIDICSDKFRDDNHGIRPAGFFVVADVVSDRQGEPLVDAAGTTFGNDVDVVTALCIAMDRSTSLLDMVTRSWVSSFVRNTSQSEDKRTLEVRRNLIRLFGEELVRQKFIPERTQRQEADDAIQQIALDHPNRESRFDLLRARAKQFRKSGLRDIEQMLLQEVERLKDEILVDEQRILDADVTRQIRRESVEENRRVRILRQAEKQELLRIEHDFDHLDRRVRAINQMIDRLQHLREQLLDEQKNIQQQHPQFDPNSAARQRRQQIAARQRQRNAQKRQSSSSAQSSSSDHQQSTKQRNRSRSVNHSCSTLFG